MSIQRLWKSALVLLTGLSIVLPSSAMAGQTPAPREVRKPASLVRDVTLDANGVLSGYLVDAQGKPEAAAAVAIHQGRKQLALTKTNARGLFEVKGLKGGVYQVTSEKSTAVFRVWKNGTAPKKASKLALLVTDQPVVRAQFEGLGLGGLTTTTLVVGGVIAGATIYAVTEANDNSN
jgi:hypothetical protein